MYPPLSAISRRVTKDFVVPETGFVMKKDMVIIIPIYGFHHDPDYFPNPEVYDPDRFSPENSEKRDPRAFIPFGGGNRYCPGYKLSIVQLKLALAYLLTNFIFSPHSIKEEISGLSPTKTPAYINLRVTRI